MTLVHNCKSAPCLVCGSTDGSGNPVDCLHEHNIEIGTYHLDKPEDQELLRQLLDKKKREWDANVEILLCADCKRHHARITMDL